MNRPAATGRERQADCVLTILTQICKRTNLRIEMYHRARALADAGGRAEHDCGLQRLRRIDEEDQKLLDGLTDHLQRRFPQHDTHKNPPISRRARLAGPGGPRRIP
jgi:hypothetical protein